MDLDRTQHSFNVSEELKQVVSLRSLADELVVAMRAADRVRQVLLSCPEHNGQVSSRHFLCLALGDIGMS